MKLLGIDYGEKRVGVAVSDETNAYAFPHSVIKNSPRLIEEVAAICAAEKIGEIVVGESNDYAGKPNKIMEKTHDFVAKVGAATGLPVHFELEFMTSVQAAHDQGVNALLDASAAALILQSFLDRRKSNVK